MMLRTAVIGLLLSATWAAASAAEPAPRPRRVTDELAAKAKPTRIIAYKQAGERTLHLHVFEPREAAKPNDRRPAFLAIHGGGWTGGNVQQFYVYADRMAQRGWVGFSLEYRLLDPKAGTTVFDCVKDGRSAVRYLRAHAAELGIDPDRIVVAGGSAGGHIAAGTALFDAVNDTSDDVSVSAAPNALVLFYPVIDTSPEGYGQKKIGERWRELSPRHHVRPGLPPTLILHGTGDTVTPFAGAAAFEKAMREAGNRCVMHTHEGGRHGYFVFDEKLFEQAMAQTDAFLESLGYPAAPLH